ncbi:type I-E CRISPR-associated protein Cas7/Cse4/CasC [Actinacidiphila epipremni]|uniref:Type I-E CRISPR-associated protein Cas7/Cse4/CasC n=1 Tax=Actinacidiphila epipremni TaxID=2053013 RepID=A0ABX0ZV99_9ACTN|nr:type I-E CRISPR-associated protein Cas7/Cse4/CasC [Actinacidiphila epipremni]NJP46496.1 type I-E CRISPR-associated protein Cas7/Cse4/CasC [Actinacidiphila epipremni]
MSTEHARFVDIHILQSVPFSNLNRDDTNSVKTVQYGNALRTRVSSQSWKRAVRERFEELTGQYTLRTRRIGERVTRELVVKEWPEALARRAGAHVAAGSSIKFELGKDRDNQVIVNKVLTNAMIYLPEPAVADLVALVEEHREELEKAKDVKKAGDKSVLPKKRVEEILRTRNGVVDLFGRMLAEVDDAGVDGAVQVAHALTTHRSDVELDYFSAVDDITDSWNDATGSGHMGNAEFSAGTFYRYATIDLRDLAANLGPDVQAARDLAGAFLSSFITSLPQAKKNATAPHTIPDLVHVAVRSDRPLSFAAAFEKPVAATPEGGYVQPSVRQLAAYASAANGLLGKDRVLAASWAGLPAGEIPAADLSGLGARKTSFDALVREAVDSALDGSSAEAAA